MKRTIKLVKTQGVYSIIVDGDYVAQSVCKKLIEDSLKRVIEQLEQMGASYQLMRLY